MSEPNEEAIPLPELDTLIEHHTDWIMEENAELILRSRKAVRTLLSIASGYRDLADEVEHLAELHIIGARRAADLNGDVLSAEWGLEKLDDLNDDEDDDEDEDED